MSGGMVWPSHWMFRLDLLPVLRAHAEGPPLYMRLDSRTRKGTGSPRGLVQAAAPLIAQAREGQWAKPHDEPSKYCLLVAFEVANP
jgi:hypothetical protein